MSETIVDFNFGKYKRSSLFFKRSAGSPVPKDASWICGCGNKNPLTEKHEQYCPKCGAKLRLQESRDASMAKPHLYEYTLIRVAHFSIPKEKEDGKTEESAG